MNKMRLKILLPMLIFVLITGCDKIELEDRALVISMGIDEDGDSDGYLLSMEIPAEFENKDDNSSNIKTSAAKTVSSAMKKIDSVSGQKLYYGHTKVCILSKDILENPTLFKSAVDGLERNREISRKLIIMCSDTKAEKIYKAKTDQNSITGIFINDFYKNNEKSLSVTFRQDLEGVIEQLLSSSNTLIPVIKNDNERLKIGSLALIKDYKLADILDEEKSRCLLWLTPYNIGGDLTVDFENTSTALSITDKKTKINIIKNDGGKYTLKCDIKVEGMIDEYILNQKIFDNTNRYQILQNKYSQVITNEAENAADFLQKEYKADLLDFGEKLRKNYYNDYIALDGKTDSAFENADIVINADVKIKGSGTIE